MSKLRIAPELALPEDVVTSTVVIYGGKGMGKTNLGSVLVEELTKARLRWCLLDPMGVSWGLRHSADGKAPGVECVILGGAHGDIPIEPTGGAVVADLVIDEGANTIIDFSRRANGEMWSLGEKVKFVTEYTLRLFRRQGELVNGKRREPLMQILDEAARYIPQQIPSGAIEIAKCVGAWEQVCEEGRNIGLGVTFITQRSARMNKSVSELADVMFAFRTVGPNSLAAIMDWLGEHVDKARVRDLGLQVRQLDVGSALVVSPGWLRVETIAHIRRRETFDSSATPKAGKATTRVTGTAAKPDLAKYRERMAATIEKAKADDPRALRARIAELEKAAKASVKERVVEKPVIDHIAVERAVADAHAQMSRSMAERDKETARLIDAVVAEWEKSRTDVNVAVNGLKDFMQYRGAVGVPYPKSATSRNTGESRAAVQVGNQQKGTGANSTPVTMAGRTSRAPASPVITHDSTISGPMQRIVNAIAELDRLGVSPAPRPTVAGLVGYHMRAKSFVNALGSLRSQGAVDYPSGGTLALTDAGRAMATSDLAFHSLDQLHEHWYSRMSGPERRIVESLVKYHPGSVERDHLAEWSGYHPRAKSFVNALGKLRTAGVIDYPNPGRVAATDVLFPNGLV